MSSQHISRSARGASRLFVAARSESSVSAALTNLVRAVQDGQRVLQQTVRLEGRRPRRLDGSVRALALSRHQAACRLASCTEDTGRVLGIFLLPHFERKRTFAPLLRPHRGGETGSKKAQLQPEPLRTITLNAHLFSQVPFYAAASDNRARATNRPGKPGPAVAVNCCRFHPTFFTICTTSSSCSTWSLPTFWGWCFTDEPQTHACLNCAMIPRWMRLQNCSTVGFCMWRMTGAE